MKNKLQNFRQLFSNDNNIMYKAILEKKDWILKPMYIVATLSSNSDIEDIFERRLRFKKAYLDSDAYSNKEAYLKAFEQFNNQFRVLYLYDEIPFVYDESDFVIEYDFRKLSDNEYKILFANFYPTLTEKERKQIEEDELIYLLKQAMDDRLGDASIILDLNNLNESCFNCNIINKIIVSNNLNDGYKMHLKLLCEKLNIEIKEVRYDN